MEKAIFIRENKILNLNDNRDIAQISLYPSTTSCYEVFTKLFRAQILQSFTEFEDKLHDLLVGREERSLYQTWRLTQLKMKPLNLPLG